MHCPVMSPSPAEPRAAQMLLCPPTWTASGGLQLQAACPSSHAAPLAVPTKPQGVYVNKDNMLDPQALWQIEIAALMIGQELVKAGLCRAVEDTS